MSEFSSVDPTTTDDFFFSHYFTRNQKTRNHFKVEAYFKIIGKVIEQ